MGKKRWAILAAAIAMVAALSYDGFKYWDIKASERLAETIAADIQNGSCTGRSYIEERNIEERDSQSWQTVCEQLATNYLNEDSQLSRTGEKTRTLRDGTFDARRSFPDYVFENSRSHVLSSEDQTVKFEIVLKDSKLDYLTVDLSFFELNIINPGPFSLSQPNEVLDEDDPQHDDLEAEINTAVDDFYELSTPSDCDDYYINHTTQELKDDTEEKAFRWLCGKIGVVRSLPAVTHSPVLTPKIYKRDDGTFEAKAGYDLVFEKAEAARVYTHYVRDTDGNWRAQYIDYSFRRPLYYDCCH